jgi:hypothetical protein
MYPNLIPASDSNSGHSEGKEEERACNRKDSGKAAREIFMSPERKCQEKSPLLTMNMDVSNVK